MQWPAPPGRRRGRKSGLQAGYGGGDSDAVLRETAHMLDTPMRGGDPACRYGGEEFVIIFLDTALAQARVIADALREAVRVTMVGWLG